MDQYWDKPIEVRGIDGAFTRIRNAEEAAAFILDRWPEAMSGRMLVPLARLIEVLEEGVCPQEARAEFQFAIREMNYLHS
jgi:hypothetical protein